MTLYDPPTYWTERGRTYEQEAHERGWWAKENEPILSLIDGLRFDSMLEVGCGFGRVGAHILARHPGVAYTGLDVSPDLIEGAQRLLPEAEFIVADLATYQTRRRWDLVLSVSVLGHLLPKDVRPVITRMRQWARRDLVAVDWDEVGGQTDYQFGHDYRDIYPVRVRITPYGRQSIFHLTPP